MSLKPKLKPGRISVFKSDPKRPPGLTVKQALNQAIDCLKKAGLDSPELDAELLLAHVLKKDRAFVLSHGEKKLSPAQQRKFRQLIGQRFRHYPIAYLLGHKEFYGLDFVITPDVLVPRPESELMVETVLGLLKGQPDALVIDVGTGSGCLAVSIAAHSRTTVLALDISKKALVVAKKNASRHNLKNITFLQNDLLKNLPASLSASKLSAAEIIIMANLPYLTSKEITDEPSIKREPRLALNGGADGLALYRRLAEQVEKIAARFERVTILSEINSHQQKEFVHIWPRGQVTFARDLSGRIRIGIVTYIKQGE